VSHALTSQGATPGGESSAEFGAYYQAEMKKWAGVIRTAGIKLDQ
jgi:hypothetical protein